MMNIVKKVKELLILHRRINKLLKVNKLLIKEYDYISFNDLNQKYELLKAMKFINSHNKHLIKLISKDNKMEVQNGN